MRALTNKNDNRICCVPQCTVKAYKCPTLSFHEIPKDEQMKKLWPVRTRRDEGPLSRIRRWTKVCSRHFVPEDFRPLPFKGKQRRLKPDAVPRLFTWNNFQRGKERKQPAVRHLLSLANINTNQSKRGMQSPQQRLQRQRQSRQRQSLTADDLSVEEQFSLAKEENKVLQERILQLEHHLQMESSRKIKNFGLERFSQDDGKIEFYTGFPNYNTLKIFDSSIVSLSI